MKVLTFNIQDGAEGRETLCLEVFRAVQPDVILLQEVVDPAVVHRWAADLGMQAVIANGNTRRRVAILSRYPVLESHSLNPIPKLSRDFLEVIVEYAPRQRMALFCVHLAAQPLFLFEWLRLQTIQRVLDEAGKYSALPTVIAGDFNAVSSADAPIYDGLPLRLQAMLRVQGNRYLGWVLSRMAWAHFVDCFRSLHADAGYTLPSLAPQVRFDYIFANRHLSAVLQNCLVVYPPSQVEAASDHCSVIAEFAL